MWKQCEHAPQTEITRPIIQSERVHRLKRRDQVRQYSRIQNDSLPRGQSSPGNVHSVQQFSKGIRQIPQLSSFAIQRQVATLVQSTNP